MVLTDIGNVPFGNQQKYYQLVFFVMKIKVIKKGYLITWLLNTLSFRQLQSNRKVNVR